MQRHIYLMGYMGCGKSTIGRALAAALEIPFLDLDEQIKNHEKCSVSELFQKKGELYFRKTEYGHLQKLLNSSDPKVVALGGGTPCYFDSIQRIKESQVVSIYLKGSVPFLAQRLFVEREHRPMISHIATVEGLQEFIGKHLFERHPFYQQAQHTITIDGKTVVALVEEIVSLT